MFMLTMCMVASPIRRYLPSYAIHSASPRFFLVWSQMCLWVCEYLEQEKSLYLCGVSSIPCTIVCFLFFATCFLERLCFYYVKNWVYSVVRVLADVLLVLFCTSDIRLRALYEFILMPLFIWTMEIGVCTFST